MAKELRKEKFDLCDQQLSEFNKNARLGDVAIEYRDGKIMHVMIKLNA